MKRLLILSFLSLSFIISAQVVNNMVVFCNDGEPFTLILNGERINMEPQTRVRVEGLTLKKYQTKVVFKNQSLKEANTTITFFSSGYECEFGVNKQSKRKYKIEYFTEKAIEGTIPKDQTQNNLNNTDQNNNSSGNNNSQNNTVNEAAPIQTITPTNTLLTGPGITNGLPTSVHMGSGMCDAPMNDGQFATFKSSVQNLSSDSEKQIKAWAMLEAACISVNQLKQLLGVFISDNSKYDFAKKVYERTKDNADYIKLKEVFLDVVVKDKFDKFLQSKK